MKRHATPARLALSTRHVRAVVPADLHDRLAHLSIDLDATIGELVIEALVLLARHHGVAEGLQEPSPPWSERSKMVRLSPVPPLV